MTENEKILIFFFILIAVHFIACWQTQPPVITELRDRLEAPKLNFYADLASTETAIPVLALSNLLQALSTSVTLNIKDLKGMGNLF